ncbi:MAG: DUF488 domain-containing protein [Pseudomonadales bacterium]
MKFDIDIKRAYVPRSQTDGYRVLVDRVWPRGIKRETLQIDLWLKDVAPSTELRRWFGHEVKRWEGFQQRYRKELDANDEAVDILRRQHQQGRLTLVYGAKDESHNQAVVLRDYLLGR